MTPRPTTDPADPRRARRAARPLADLVSPAIEPACRKRGFATTELVTLWPELVPPALANTRPMKIDWPRRRGVEAPDETATLTVAADGPAALVLSYQGEQLIERLNALLGWRAIGRLRIVQRPPLPARPTRRAGPPPLDAAGEARLARAVGGVAHGPLALALGRLGRAALAPEEAAATGGPNNRPNPSSLSAACASDPRAAAAPPVAHHPGVRPC